VELTTAQIAHLLDGRLHGSETCLIRGAASLNEAGPQDISYLKDPKNEKFLPSSKAGAILVPEGTRLDGHTLIEVHHPQAAFARILDLIAKEIRPAQEGIHPQSYISPKAKIGQHVSIGPFTVIEDDAEIGDGVRLLSQVYVGRRAKVGQNSLLYPHVVLREDVCIGQRCIIHAGAVIGSDGYGFYFSDGKHNKIEQIGTVIVEDDVEIGSCTTIDRATTGATIVHQGAKIDNLVQIAHNVEIGAHSLLVAQVGIAGSSRIGKGVVIAGQVGVADHVNIGDGAQIGAQSGLKQDVPPGAIMFGSPAQPIQETLKQVTLIRKLPDLFKDVKKLKERFLKND